MKEISKKVKEWLTPVGVEHFQELIKEHGEGWSTACPVKGGVPMPVHFREGMQVRNFLRGNTELDEAYIENRWHKIIEEAVDG